MDAIFIFGAKYLYFIIIAIGAAVFLLMPRKDQKRMIVLACVSLPIIYLVAIIVAHFYFDPRPFVVGNFTPLVPHAPDNGFPSDHVLLTASVTALFFVFRRRISYLLALLTGIVAVSRVYVGVHHITDVVGSIVIVAAGVVVGHFVFKELQKRNFPWTQ